MNTDSQRVRGSASNSTDLQNRVSGTARIGPSGPMMIAQSTREMNVVVMFSPTASPVTFGWITMEAMKFTTT